MDKKRSCGVDGCEREYLCKGYCEMHYQRWKKYGDPLGGGTFQGSGIKFLESLLDAPETDECIEWPFSIKGGGYGSVKYKGKTINAHRAMLLIKYGDNSGDGMDAAHEPIVCHNRACVNPKHLRWATQSENMQDRSIDGTQFIARGVNSVNAKLTDQYVREIRSSNDSLSELAERYNVSEWTIRNAKNGSTWKHVE